MQAAVESRWAFPTVSAERTCATEQHHDCLSRTPGLATAAALVIVLGAQPLFAWTWIVGRREEKPCPISGQPAQTS